MADLGAICKAVTATKRLTHASVAVPSGQAKCTPYPPDRARELRQAKGRLPDGRSLPPGRWAVIPRRSS